MNKKRLPLALQRAIELRRISLDHLAQRVDSTYEHMRRLVRGLAYPSRNLLRSIAMVLGEDFEQLQNKLELDKLYERYGGIPKFLKSEPRLPKQLQDDFMKLSPCNREIAVATARILLKYQNQKTVP